MITEERITEILKFWSNDCRDINVRLKNIVFSPGTVVSDKPTHEWAISLPNFTKLLPTHLAQGHLLNRLTIPISYFHRCPMWLQSSMFDYWNQQFGEKEVCLRTFNEGKLVRGVVSTRFNKEIDDKYTVPTILNILPIISQTNNLGPFEYIEFHKIDTLTSWTISFPQTIASRNGRNLIACIHYINSEVGLSSMSIAPHVAITYQNDPSMISHIFSKGQGVSFYHSRKDIGDLDTIMARVAEEAQYGIRNLLVAGEQQIDNPFKTMEYIVNKYDEVPNKILEYLEDDWKMAAVASKLEVAEAIFQAIAGLPLVSQYQAASCLSRHFNIFEKNEMIISDILDDITEE